MYEHLLCFGLFSAWCFFSNSRSRKNLLLHTQTHCARSKCGFLLCSCPKCWNTKSCLVAAPCPREDYFFFPLVYFSSLYDSYARTYFKNPRSLQKNKSLWHSARLFLWNWVSYVSWSEKKVVAFLNFFFFSPVHKSPHIWVNGLLWKRRQQQVEEALLN